MTGELIEAFNRVNHDDDCNVVVVKGAGKNFCAGFDLVHGLQSLWRQPHQQAVPENPLAGRPGPAIWFSPGHPELQQSHHQPGPRLGHRSRICTSSNVPTSWSPPTIPSSPREDRDWPSVACRPYPWSWSWDTPRKWSSAF